MALGFVFDDEIPALPSRKLRGARLFGVEMVKTRLARQNLPVLGKFQALTV